MVCVGALASLSLMKNSQMILKMTPIASVFVKVV